MKKVSKIQATRTACTGNTLFDVKWMKDVNIVGGEDIEQLLCEISSHESCHGSNHSQGSVSMNAGYCPKLMLKILDI